MIQSTIASGPTSRRGVGFLAIVFVFFVGLCGALGPAPAHALTLDFDHSTGELRGASGVNVDGTLYNVTFRDGTCVDLFNGCDQIEDFPFSQSVASIASQALLDQVFLDIAEVGLFDSDPALTRGCGGTTCVAVTPFDFFDNFGNVSVSSAVNFDDTNVQLVDEVVDQQLPRDFDLTCCQGVWVQWAPSAHGGTIPEPSTILFLATGLLGLAAGAWWRQRRAEGHQVG